MEYLSKPDFYINKEGEWYVDGILASRKEILLLYVSHLKKDEEGVFYIDYQNKKHFVRVEDVPFYAVSLSEEGSDLRLQLHDTREVSLPLGNGNIMIKNKIPYVSLFWEIIDIIILFLIKPGYPFLGSPNHKYLSFIRIGQFKAHLQN